MSHTANTVSIRELQTAVKGALESAKKKHHNLKFDAVLDTSAPLPMLVRFPWICGYPVPWPIDDLGGLNEFNETFVGVLAGNPAISALGVEGKFAPALYITGGKAAIGFVPSAALVTA
jgi:hypothetical protein